MPYQPPPDLAGLSLADLERAVAQRRLPPVDLWNPSETADSHMRIAADGTWYHQGVRLARPAMVRAFASLLVRDDEGRHWLMTPDCRQSVEVEDAAFIAVDMQAREGALAFRLNTDDIVLAGLDHPLRAAGDPDAPAIYLAVRHGCEARLDRSTWLQLAEHALAGDGGGDDGRAADGPAVESLGARFSLVPA